MEQSVASHCKLISGLFELSVFFIGPAGDVLVECLDDRMLNPLYGNDKQLFFNVLELEPAICKEIPVIRKTLFFENYISMSVVSNQSFEGTIIVGPSLPFTLFDHKINGLINDTNLFANREQVFHYYQSLPVITYGKLVNIAVLIYQMFSGKFIAADQIQDQLELQVEETKMPGAIRFAPNDELAPHHNPLYEKKLLTIIREGQTEALKRFSQLGKENTGILSKSSHIRSKKNLGIIGIALAARAAIEGGLHSEISFSVSDLYIQRLEELRTEKEIDQLCLVAFFELTEKVAQVKEARYSKTVTTCKNYIYDQRFSRITHESIAGHAGISPNYLSVIFKKETGVPVNEYIQQIKIEEAKNMILFSNTPLSEIGSLLSFSDQSYFTKVFKKHTGLTPKQYQQTQYLSQ
ncbi:AraC family transcriptional regulator [Paenibacillus sp. FSL R7-269]|uniref:helix-turn-helix domain-containing protein n=1 Tax=Paenibacillus sp. FSL R7-269 TaxID=1226755 RepID=UPI0003E1E27D|nr:helix-turn-helix domain-containing protein [Paenibacillus sp. FSL R7-269]ETT32929.1 AraC family transcriptional regulator [Paenibacillus sp. FSL R7-269]